MAWLAIGLVAILAVLVPERTGRRERDADHDLGPGAASRTSRPDRIGASAGASASTRTADRPRARAAGTSMIERLARFLGGASFHRGLALGALVGAAIAGSTLWARLRSPGARRSAMGRPNRALPDSPTHNDPV